MRQASKKGGVTVNQNNEGGIREEVKREQDRE